MYNIIYSLDKLILIAKGELNMSKEMKIYDLLISCPGDIESSVELLKDKVDNFNKLFGRHNNIFVQTRYWKDDVFSESGGKPQTLINKQIVDDADLAVAIFWTRFGTPTESYGSGVEEEIEIMLNSGKQVFMYFIEKPIKPSSFDSESYSKIIQFRKRYSERGIYKVANSEEIMADLFRNDLEQYFIKKMI